ncbi:MAG: hypothetical protein GY863_01965 [bacterium]|nr:hypothetical protein [bacterium]
MGKGNSNKVLGISFGAEEVNLIETESSAKEVKITAVKKIDSSLPFSIDLISEDSGAELLGSELKDTLENNDITSKNVSLSLDLSFGSLIKIPYHKKLSENDLNSHLKWELQQYVEDDVDDYIFDSYKLVSAPSMKYPELILAGARTKVVEFFKEMCEHAELELRTITMDLLSAVNTFEKNYQHSTDEKTALVEIGEQKLVFTLLEGNLLIGHHYVFLDASVRSDYLNNVSELISLNLKTLFTDHDLGKDKSSFDQVYLYRANTKYSVNSLIESSTEHELLLFNPFEKVRLDSDLKDELDFLGDNSEFVEPLGLTLI